MTITQLEYVAAVVACGSFAEAAARSFVTQPTLSIQIKKLEDELGVTLFDRSRKPVLVTDIGRAVAEQAKSIIREAARIKEMISDQQQELAGELRIGIIPTLSPYLLPRFVTAFVEAYPRVQLVVQELLSEEIMERLRNDRLDTGIMVAPASLANMTSTPLFREEFMLYLSSNHRMCKLREVEPSRLDTSDMWLLSDGHCFRDQIETLCGKAVGTPQEPPPLQFQSGSLETIRKIVDKKHGYTLLPELAVLDLPMKLQGNVRRFKRSRPVREISLVVHRNYLKVRLIAALRDVIIANLPASLNERRNEQVIEWTR